MTLSKWTKTLPIETRAALRAARSILLVWDAGIFIHGDRVARALFSLAPQGQQDEYYWAGALHDIGKITLAPEILNKRKRLSRKERKMMQRHPAKGAAILGRIGAPQTVVDGARFHHARWDGLGYPSQIREQEIPLIARVLAVVDVYTALTSHRPYHRAFTPEQARTEIERNAGTQFDPSIVVRFFERESHVS